LDEKMLASVNSALSQRAPDLLAWASESEERGIQLREVVNAARAPYVEVLDGLPVTEIGERFSRIQGQVNQEVLAALVDLREAVEAKLEAARRQFLEYAQLLGGGECVVCSALLTPNIPTVPPHCWDCSPTDEHYEEWSATVHALASSLESRGG
jgi:hypothetical protein